MPARDQRRSGPATPSWRAARLARARLASAEGLSAQERRRLRSQIRRRDKVARARQSRHVGVAVAGAGAVMAVVATAFALGPAIDAARGEGAVGTLTVESQLCYRDACSWVGTFVSRGGQVTSGVAYQGRLPADTGPGSSVPAIYAGSHVAFAPHGSLVWLEDLLLVVLIGGAMAVALWISPIGMPGRRRREIRRTARAA
jgi:hypothetical protein